jgi:hypothetical protein
MSYENSSRSFCYNRYVHSLVLAFAIIGLILNIPYIAVIVAILNTKDFQYRYLIPLVPFLCYVLLIVANRTKIRALYLVYMVIKAGCIDISDLF